jgi:AraC family transcriptional regulator
MDWAKEINDALNYIEEHITGDISYEQIAKIAYCSVYNFQRVFSYIADTSLSEYIRNRKLTLAAFDILNTEERIIDIALKYGYESQDSFAKAFKNFHGTLPSKVRTETVMLKSCPKFSFKIILEGDTPMKYQIELWPAFSVAGIKRRMKTEQAFAVVPAIWEAAWKDGTMDRLLELFRKTDYRPSGFIGMSVGGQWGNSDEMDYIMGVTNHVEVENCTYVPAPDNMEEVHIKSAVWVVFEANGTLPEAVQSIYKQFYSEWLPHSGYILEDLPTVECYFPDNRQEVWVAVRKE